MSDDTRQMLLDTLDRVLTDHCTAERVQAADAGGFDPALWQVLDELGYPLVAVPEALGGIGLALPDQCALLRLAGRHCAPVPLAESAMLAAWLLASAGLPPGTGVLAAASAGSLLSITPAGDGLRLQGTLPRVGAARHATALVLLLDGHLAVLTPAEYALEAGDNLAGEARDDLHLDLTLAADRLHATDVTPDAFAARAALLRAALMTGALERALQQSLDYTRERRQFGRPLAAFQAIQQQLAILAAEVVAAMSAVDHAAAVAEHGAARDEIAAAKIRAGKAAGIACRIAHQVHGAMGFTQEYPLHHATRRLWSWRDEAGNEALWAQRLGRRLAAAGADALWPLTTASGAAAD
ncbi:acyl-CoA dehydrogenase family protein [Immundisolibacter sp.]|uniref:acyl-CoA dehydrogenase family protein n=1 Tax=Immundisolibacter sp. TaxID=1934948 RepID=UPI002632A2E9|nr:acyl-CoA dehydrogenase family protein [Immundisolibacter sp.]MDD3649972.1 acyl-CoA/acyl-ACP dehydrogenase [Immundisolibacter sp.]